LHLTDAHSPLWQVEGVEGARIERDELGLMSLADLPSGRHTVRLRFSLPRYPLVLTFIGIALIVGLAALGLVRARSARRGDAPAPRDLTQPAVHTRER